MKGVTWYGRDIETLTREELIKALSDCVLMMERDRQQRQRERELMQELRNRNR